MAAWRRIAFRLLTARLFRCKPVSLGRCAREFTSSKALRKGNDFFKDLESEMKKFHEKFVTALPGSDWTPIHMNTNLPPERADIVIVGGGIMGWAIAYWLKKKERIRDGVRVVVVERDPTYTQASTVLSVGGIRQQFSMPENIHMSLFSCYFLRNINEYLSVMNEDPIDVQFNHAGYLFLASENGAQVMEENYHIQRREGANVILLSPEQLKKKFPWINTEGVALASYGLENEGWFDPWILLNAFRKKAISMGVYQCFGDVTGFKTSSRQMVTASGEKVDFKRIHHVIVQMPNSAEYQPVECALVVNAAGAWSGNVAQMAGIGEDSKDNILSMPVPVEPRKRYVYVFHSPEGPGLDMPMLIDNSGAYARREGLGGNYLGGQSPTEDGEPEVSNLDVNYDFFTENVWPNLANRIPSFQNLKVKSAWAGYYDYNTFDQNAILGIHPLVNNLYFATGFSGHGIQQAPAVGRAIAELILDGDFQTLDLTNLGFKRLFIGEKMLERNIV
ncbi:FAD-dependent oxidoreductase domain-containing protein 1 [Polypterus senegalus]|uniref:FAD-dependent oxidoreductase domain-containing protein 1 n=1 Tax=Polypterus senegalus TaxID=55291 RepID=UPI001963AD81|nr:FAD-dependent oxidoreductase domain-containing protein 1 [Polypterus senegalus]